MKDFIFRNDTKLLFRNDIRETIAEVTKGHKVMFVYGSGSVKRNGCYDDIIRPAVRRMDLGLYPSIRRRTISERHTAYRPTMLFFVPNIP